MKHFNRKKELSLLEDFALSPKSEFIYVRGRRRVGKSWLLNDFMQKKENRFLFTGSPDSTMEHSLSSFINRWMEFSQETELGDLKTSVLDWPRVFKEINTYTQKRKKTLVMVFDEIQWISKEGMGFAGALKEAWVLWQRNNWIKVIICGSSNKFFKKMTGGEEKILRGLQTRAHLWVEPLTPHQIKNHCFPSWSQEEVCLAYMMTGGILYYLERIDPTKGFIHGINNAFFTQANNLLDEMQELLDLDFNKAGRRTVDKILSVLGQDGCDQKNIAKKTGLPKSSVSRVIEKLLDYGIVHEKIPAHSMPLRNGEGIRYYMKDFFMNFYYQILAPLGFKIRNNMSGLIFPDTTDLSQKGYYIPNFSGKAFELLIRYIFEKKIGLDSAFYQKIMLKDDQYTVMDYWNKNTQIDLLLESTKDRIVRVLECKWGKPDTAWLHALKAKIYQPRNSFFRKNVLVLGTTPSQQFLKQAAENSITVITLKDFFRDNSRGN